MFIAFQITGRYDLVCIHIVSKLPNFSSKAHGHILTQGVYYNIFTSKGQDKVIPIHAEVISMCEEIGFDYMGAIIWQKKTTMNTTGGAVIMGSFPYPPNGIIEIDYEFILIFKKEGKRKVPKDKKELSVLSKEEWKEYFSGHWKFGGAKQVEHEAVFPEELPKRLIKMFSFVGDRVLDPFAGSGTTLKSALELGREAIGYEINPEFVELIKRKVGTFGRAWVNHF
jgi:DNA modification methylase